MEERGACRFDGAGLVAEHPVVEATVDHRDRMEQRVVEDVEDRVGFLDRRRLLERDRGRAEQRVDLVVETAVAFLLVRSAQHAVRGELVGDAADLAFHGLASRLGRMGGEDRMELETVEQLLRLGRAHLGDELMVGLRHLVDRVNRQRIIHFRLALMQHGDAVVLLAEVRKMEVRGECARKQLRVVQIHRVDRLDGHFKVVALGMGVGEDAGETFRACVDGVLTHGVEGVEQRFVVFGEHSTQNFETQIHVFVKCGGSSRSSGALVPSPDVTMAASAGVICSLSVTLTSF